MQSGLFNFVNHFIFPFHSKLMVSSIITTIFQNERKSPTIYVNILHLDVRTRSRSLWSTANSTLYPPVRKPNRLEVMLHCSGNTLSSNATHKRIVISKRPYDNILYQPFSVLNLLQSFILFIPGQWP